MDRLKQDVPIWKRGARSAGFQPRRESKCRRRRAGSETGAPFTRRSDFGNSIALPAAARRARATRRRLWPRPARNGLRAGGFAAVRPLHARWLRDFAERRLRSFSSRGHASRRRLEAAPVQTRRSRARGYRRIVAVRKSARRDAGTRRAHRRPNSHRPPRDRHATSAFAAKICGRASRCCTLAQNWMPARWRCWQRRETSIRLSARDCALFISRLATKSFRRTRRRNRAKFATAIRF